MIGALSHLKYTLTGIAWLSFAMMSLVGSQGLVRFVQVMPGAALAALPLAWGLGRFIIRRLESTRRLA